MKKILLSIVGFFLCAVCVFSAVGCKPKDYGETTTDTTKVTANGGSSVVYDGYLYFVNGMGTNDGDNNGGTMGSIYKVAIDADGNVAENASYTKVVDALVGYDKGSINIIGDFLYYTTPGTGKNKKGEVLYNKTKFMRYNLKKDIAQEIYVTADNNADEDVTFAYYKTGENQKNLNLVVYEATSKTLKSFKIGNEIETVFSKTDVQSVVFSEKMGSKVDNADNFVFYTLSYKTNSPDTNTNRVYRIGADGSNDTLISDSAKLSLLCIRSGKLVFTATFGSGTSQVVTTYAYPVTSATKNGDIVIVDPSNSKNPDPKNFEYVISYNDYEEVIFLEESDGSVALVYLESKSIFYEKFDGKTSSSVLYRIHTFRTTPTISFIGTFTHVDEEQNKTGYVIFTNKDGSDNVVYKLRYTFVNQSDVLANVPEPEALTTSNVELESESSSDDAITFGNMTPKIIGNNVYVFVTDEDKNVLLHKVSIYTPEELAEQNPPEENPDGGEEDEDKLEVGAAQVIGGAEI